MNFRRSNVSVEAMLAPANRQTHIRKGIGLKTAFAVCLLAILTAGIACGQAITGAISGTVQDSSGAAISSARVTLTESETGVQQTATSNEHGDFTFNAVLPGVYTAKIEAPSFKTEVIPDINLTASQKLPLPKTVLQVGETHDTVTVQADVAVVQTSSSERSAVVTATQMDDLLNNGRSALNMVALVPGAVGNDISGLRATQVSITSDGINILESGSESNTNATMPMDAVGEVKVLTSNFQAEFGRKSGAGIQLVTKSGTRDFHGLFSYYKQNEEFNANSWANNRNGLAKGRDRVNLYTFNVSGPAFIPHIPLNTKRDKLFFFWNEEFRPSSASSSFQSTVPTALERVGNFSASTLKPTNPSTGAPYPGGIIPSSVIDTNGQSLLDFLPLPNFSNTAISKGAYNYVDQVGSISPTRNDLLKVDIPVREKDSLSVNYTHNGPNTIFGASSPLGPNPLGITAGFPVLTGGLYALRIFASVHYAHIFSPSVVNEITTGWTFGRTFDDTPASARSVVEKSVVGFDVSQFFPAGNPLGIIPDFSFGSAIPGAQGISFEQRYPFANGRRNLQFGDNLSKVYQNHSFKVGFYFERLWVVEGPAAANFSGNFDFSSNASNPLNTGNPYANAVTGVFNEYQEASFRPDPIMIANSIEGFAQDTWKVTRRLTLDYGLRFSNIQPWGEAGNAMDELVPSQFNAAQAVKLIQPTLVSGVRMGINPANGIIYPAALIGAIAPGSGNFQNGIVFANATGGNYPKQLMNGNGIKVGPRAGFAYDVFGDGKMAVRGGFGIGYDRVSDGIVGLSSTAAQYPLIQTPVVYYGKLSNFLSAGSGFVFPSSIVTLDKSGKIPSAYTMSFGVQRNMGHGILLDVAYSGSLGRNLYWAQNLASVPFGSDFLPQNQDPTKPGSPLPATFLQRYPGYGNVVLYDPGASSNYNALITNVTRHFSRNLQFGGSFTWSKALDYVDSDTSAVSTLISPRVYNYGPAGFDRSRAVKINWLYSIPGAGHLHWAVAKEFFGNWKLSGIATFTSGAPLTVSVTTNNGADITGSTTDPLARPNVTGNVALPSGKQSIYEWFNTAAFPLPALGTQGNEAKGEFRGPDTNDIDMSLIKQFTALHEKLRFEFRAEAYNSLNHTQYTSIGTSEILNPSTGAQTNGTFGQVTGAASPRIMQLGLRFLF